jgi:uncharacterized membrane protein YiaA
MFLVSVSAMFVGMWNATMRGLFGHHTIVGWR